MKFVLPLIKSNVVLFRSQDGGIPQPYDFGYNIQDEYGNNQFRQESADNRGVVKGSYGYMNNHLKYFIMKKVRVSELHVVDWKEFMRLF